MKKLLAVLTLITTLTAPSSHAAPSGPVRVLFLGHDGEHHDSNKFFPMLAEALGKDAIYFDYVTTVEAALEDASYLRKFDAVLLYANHYEITKKQLANLKNYVESGGGFVPVHCASWCFNKEADFVELVGGQFDHHQTGVFRLKTLLRDHPAIKDVPELEAWDETYTHKKHKVKNRVVLQVREVAGPGDNIKTPEPWTWIRTQGRGRVFYTASGHDERVWGRAEFHSLLKKGILWAVGDNRLSSYNDFIAKRPPLKYEKRDNIPNYENRPEPLKYQLPLSPEASMQYTRAPVGFRWELFAAEPQIVNPIYMQWDERGRLWVAESKDYPNEITEDRKGNDSIKILEDTNGDGRCDKVTVFADGLNIPTSFTFSKGGIIVAHAPDFLFLQDTNGDDKADVRKVLFSGWGVRDTHAGPSNLRYGFDNQIWGVVGYSRFKGELGGRQHDFGMGIYRFQADASDIEFLYQFNNNSWGLGFNSAGDVFGSTANNNPSFFGGLPQTIYGGKKRMSAKMIADNSRFHPITPNIRQVDVFGGYTAGAGHALATSDAFPPDWRDQMAFIAGPTGDLLGGYRLMRDGSGYKARNAFAIVASVDEWFSPILAEVGPDGNLWVADWYNFIIQHNPTPKSDRGGYDAKTGQGNAHVNPNRDRQHGRIYRLVWDGASKSRIASLAGASTGELVAAFENDNLFWRLTAQRLLVEGGKKEAVNSLRKRVAGGGNGAIHSLWTLHGLGALDAETHKTAILSKDAALRRNAVKAIGADAQTFQLMFDSTVLADPDLLVRREAFAKLAALPNAGVRTRTASLLLKQQPNASDEWLSLALHAAGGSVQTFGGFKTGPNLIANASFEEADGKLPAAWSAIRYSGGNDTLEMAVESDPDHVRSGRNSVRIASTTGHDASLTTSVELKNDTEYRLSAWVKTKGVTGARGAQLNIHQLQRSGATQGIQGDNDWTGIQSRFNTGNRGGKASLNALFGGWGQSKGTAWFDDLELVELIPITGPSPGGEVAGDAARGRKIFLEHQVAGCIRCHGLDGQGGIVGPPLDDLALRKDRAYILESLVNPSAKLAEGYEQLVNTPMPPMNIVLNDQELADVMDFLLTLKSKVKPVKAPTTAAGAFE
jgi:putative membrane-bound dehydrogenase-like protein